MRPYSPDEHAHMIPLKAHELPVGTPLTFAVVDSDGSLIFEPGHVVANESERALLFDCCQPHRIAGEGSDDAGEGHSEPLVELKLRIGTRLQIRPASCISARNSVSAIIGLAPNRMIFVTMPRESGQVLPLREGELLQLRGFSGESVFAAVCTIEHVVHRPFEYLVLSEPAQTRRMQVRHAMRIPTRLLARVSPGDNRRSEQYKAALVTDLSATGVAIRAREAFAAIGDIMRLHFSIAGSDVHSKIDALGEVRHISRPAHTNEPIKYGVEFRDLDPMQSVALKCFVYERMITSP